MEQQDKSKQPIRLTLTFGDGHTLNYDVFFAFVAENLLPVGKKDGRVYYTATDEGFSTYAFSAIAADATVVAGLFAAIEAAIGSIIEGADAKLALELLAAQQRLNTKKTHLYSEMKIFRKNIKEN